MSKTLNAWNFDDQMPSVSDALVDYIENLQGEAFNQFALDVWDGQKNGALFFGNGKIQSRMFAVTLGGHLIRQPSQAILDRFDNDPEFASAVIAGLVPKAMPYLVMPEDQREGHTDAPVTDLDSAFEVLGGEHYPSKSSGAQMACRVSDLNPDSLHMALGIYPYVLNAAEKLSSARNDQIACFDYKIIEDVEQRAYGTSVEQYWNALLDAGERIDLPDDIGRHIEGQTTVFLDAMSAERCRDMMHAELVVVDTIAVAQFNEPDLIGLSTLVFFPADTLRPEYRPEPDDPPTPSM